MKSEIKNQDWSEFDKLMEVLGANLYEVPEHEIKDEIKSKLYGADVMTDAQHKMIIAIFINELDWNAHDAFMFILKVIPELRDRLKKRILKETEISGLYQVLKKNEASKLINILKSISKRQRINIKTFQRLQDIKNKE